MRLTARKHFGYIENPFISLEPLLKKYNKPYEKKVYPDEGHGLMKLKNRIDALKLTLDFFQRHLQQ